MTRLALLFSLLLSCLFFAGGSTAALAQTAPDAIEGHWLTDNGKAKFHIFKTTAGTYAGRLVWMHHPDDEAGNPKTDTENPNESLRGRALQNAVLLTGLKWDAAEKEYRGGKVYDPTSGKTYSCNASMQGEDLKLRGYVGVSLLGKTTVWTRTTAP